MLESRKEKTMSVASDDQIRRELLTEVHKWTIKTFPARMAAAGGAAEAEVRIQMKEEADKWVEYNLEQRKQGKEGTASPDEKA
jgi:hypothetical protein